MCFSLVFFKLLSSLHFLQGRGVDVQLLMSGEGLSDVPLLGIGVQHIYPVLLRRGVRIFELQNKHLHAKTMTIDGIYSSVGSFNLDSLSEACNLEVSTTILDPCIAKTMQLQFYEDLKHAKEVKLDQLKRRGYLTQAFHW